MHECFRLLRQSFPKFLWGNSDTCAHQLGRSRDARTQPFRVIILSRRQTCLQVAGECFQNIILQFVGIESSPTSPLCIIYLPSSRHQFSVDLQRIVLGTNGLEPCQIRSAVILEDLLTKSCVVHVVILRCLASRLKLGLDYVCH